MKKLTDKQEQFCREYVIDHNATQAAIRSGYSEKTANNNIMQLMVNNGVKERIEELQSKQNEQLEIDALWVRKEFKYMYDKCRDEESHSALKALESLAKHTGFYERDNEQKKNEMNVTVDARKEARQTIAELGKSIRRGIVSSSE